MNGQWQIARQRDYRGGETQAILPEMVGRNQLLRMENALIFPNGYATAFHQTDIQILINATNGVCLESVGSSSYQYFVTNVTGTIITGILETKATSPVDASGGTAHTVANAFIKGMSLSVPYLGKNYCPNYDAGLVHGGVLNLDDLTLTTIAGKNIKRLYTYDNRLWGVCTDGTLIISNNGDATTWNPLNVILLPNSDPIIDFIPVSGGAIVYGKTSVYAMYGSSYLDISFVLLLDRQIFNSGPVNVDNTVYIVGTRGVYEVSLNGARLIEHTQNDYFKSLFSVFSQSAIDVDVVNGIYLQRFQAIFFTWSSGYGGTQSFAFYPYTKAFTKINELLDPLFPYIMALNDGETDFIQGKGSGTFVKSSYPSSTTYSPRISTIQTRHEDADSIRNKVWRELSIETAEAVYGVAIDAFLDFSDTATVISANETFAAGRNVIFLNIPRSQTISFGFTFNNSVNVFLFDDSGNNLTDENGDNLYVSQSAGNYTLKELRLKYREAGPLI